MACKPLDPKVVFDNKTISVNKLIKVFNIKRGITCRERYGYFSSLEMRTELSYNSTYCIFTTENHYYINYKTIDGKMVTTLLDVDDGHGFTHFCTI